MQSGARLVFELVEIADDRAAAVTPCADFAPFFILAAEGDAVVPAAEAKKLTAPSSRIGAVNFLF